MNHYQDFERWLRERGNTPLVATDYARRRIAALKSHLGISLADLYKDATAANADISGSELLAKLKAAVRNTLEDAYASNTSLSKKAFGICKTAANRYVDYKVGQVSRPSTRATSNERSTQPVNSVKAVISTPPSTQGSKSVTKSSPNSQVKAEKAFWSKREIILALKNRIQTQCRFYRKVDFSFMPRIMGETYLGSRVFDEYFRSPKVNETRVLINERADYWIVEDIDQLGFEPYATGTYVAVAYANGKRSEIFHRDLDGNVVPLTEMVPSLAKITLDHTEAFCTQVEMLIERNSLPTLSALSNHIHRQQDLHGLPRRGKKSYQATPVLHPIKGSGFFNSTTVAGLAAEFQMMVSSGYMQLELMGGTMNSKKGDKPIPTLFEGERIVP